MTRREYTERVLANLHRVTRRERAAIQAELDAHMEDHICDLLDLGYPPELAEERTLSFMGDPAEVGRELDKQYPLRWLAAKWAAMALTLALVLLVLGPAWTLAGTVADNLWNRFYPLHQMDLWDISFAGYVDGEYVHIVAETADVDLRQTSGGVGLRVYQAGLEDPAAEETTAWLAVSIYSENPFRGYPGVLRSGLTVPGGSSGYQNLYTFSHDFGGPFMVSSQVKRGEDLTFTYEQGGHSFTFTVPLPWEEAAP